MALELPLPLQVLTHAHWTLGREKMSKSTGNGVDPFFALERFGVDTMRFFLSLRGGIKDDSSYDNDFILQSYKTDLQGSLGNLVSRVVGGKGWNIRRAVQSAHRARTSDDRSHWQLLDQLPDAALTKVEKDLDSGAALHTIMGVIREVCSICSSSYRPKACHANTPA